MKNLGNMMKQAQQMQERMAELVRAVLDAFPGAKIEAVREIAREAASEPDPSASDASDDDASDDDGPQGDDL